MVRNDTTSPVWAALADVKRRQIITLLEEKPRTTGELCAYFDVSRFAVMKHLKILEQAGLIKVRREGRRRWNYLNSELVPVTGPPVAGAFGNGDPRLSELIKAPESLVDATHVELQLVLPASAADIFLALTRDVNAWWSERTFSGGRVTLEPVVGGRFWEVADDGAAGVLYGTVIYVDRDREMWLDSPFGFIDRAVCGRLGFRLEPCATGTRLELRQVLAGEVDDRLAQQLRERWQHLLDCRLRAYLGDRSGPAA